MSKQFAPVGNGRVLTYVFAGEGQELVYMRGTNILRVVSDGHEMRYAAIGDEIVTGDFDLPPLAARALPAPGRAAHGIGGAAARIQAHPARRR